MASIRNMPNGKYQILYRDLAGRQRSTVRSAKRAANSAKAAIENALANGQDPRAIGATESAAATHGGLTIGQLFDWHDGNHIVHLRSRTTPRASLNYWRAHFGEDTPAARVDASEIVAGARELRATRTPSTVLRKVRALGPAFGNAVLKAATDPAFAGIANPVPNAVAELKGQRLRGSAVVGPSIARDRRPTPDEFDRITADLRAVTERRREYKRVSHFFPGQALTVGIELDLTGGRLARLRWRDVHARHLVIGAVRGRPGLEVPLTDAAQRAIAECGPPRGPGALVFGFRSSSHINITLKDIVSATGVAPHYSALLGMLPTLASEQRAALVAAALTAEPKSRRQNWSDADLAGAVRFAVATSMRRAEVCALEWKDIDRSGAIPVAHVRHAPKEKRYVKNDKSRKVPLTADALAVLDALEQPDSAHSRARVFPLKPDALTDAFAASRARLGIEDLRLHDMRHEALSRLAEQYPSLTAAELSEFSGHNDRRTLDRYINPSLASIAKKLQPPGA